MKNTSAIIKMMSIAVITGIAISQPAFCQETGKGSCPIGLNCFTVNITPSSGKQIKMRLPQDIRSGDVISGTVIEENISAAPTTNKISSTLEGMVIEIDGKQTRLSQKVFSFLVPAGVTSIPFLLKNATGGVIQNGQIQVAPRYEPPLPDVWWSEQPPGSYNMPPVALTGEPLQIHGPFDGDASNTKVSLNGHPCEIIAESPRMSLVNIPQEATTGASEIRVEENTNKEAAKINIINLGLAANKTSLLKGEKTTVHVTVSGLEGLDLRNGNTLKLNLKNKSPQTITYSGEAGNVIIKDINEESVKDGKYEFSTRIVGVTKGSYSITATVAAPKDDNGCVKKYQDCMAQIKTDKEQGIKRCQEAGGKGVEDCITQVNNAAAKLEQACLDEFLKCKK